MADLELHKISETTSTITLGWTPVPGAGYRFTREKAAGKFSHTWDATRKDARFSKDSDWYKVQALGVAAEDIYPPPVTPQPGSDWERFLAWYQPEGPVVIPNKTATSQADARAKIAALATGDVLRITGVTFTEAGDRPCLRLHSLPDCTIEFVDCKAVHSGTTLYPVVDVWHWHPNATVYGLYITGPKANSGIRPEDSAGFWWGFKIHDTGGAGLMPVAAKADDGPYDYRGEITNCALRLDLDPHYEPGTGGHASYVGGGPHANTGTFVLYVHDQPYGAACQIGSNVHDCTFVVWGERLNFAAQSQVAGNVLQWWGSNLARCTVPFVYGKDIQGRVVETDGTGGADTPIVTEYGRGERVCLNPRLSNVGFAPKPNFVYQDCEATF